MNDARNLTRALTSEDLIKKYNLNDLKSIKVSVKELTSSVDRQYTLIKEYCKLMDIYKTRDDIQHSWFYDDIPTTENEPYISFDDKEDIVGDLYYSRIYGTVYQLVKNEDESYSWVQIEDANLVESMAIAASEADTNDNKRYVYYIQPVPPYYAGDIWMNNGIIYRCCVAREAQVFNIADWTEQKNYSDSSVILDVKAVLDSYKEDVEATYSTKSELTTAVNEINAYVESNTETINNTITNKVEQVMNDTYTKTEVSQIINGSYVDADNNKVEVTSVSTESGKFSNEGLRIEKTSNGTVISATSSLFNEDGLTVQKVNNGVVDTTSPVLFSGYITEDNTNEKFERYKGQSITASNNMIVDKYLVIGSKSRIEEYTDNGTTKTGIFPL